MILSFPSCGTKIIDSAPQFCPSRGSRLPASPAGAGPAKAEKTPGLSITTIAGILLAVGIGAVLVPAIIIHLPQENLTGGLTNLTPTITGPFPAGPSSPPPAIAGNATPPAVTSLPIPSTEPAAAPSEPSAPATPAAVTLAGSPAPVTDGSPVPAVINTTILETRVHALVNHVRQVYGLPLLGEDSALASLARAHSNDMAANGYFGHENLRGMDATARGAAAGYACKKMHDAYYTSGIAENLFAATPYNGLLYMNGRPAGTGGGFEEMFAQMTVAGWMNSTSHRANILDPELSHEGIGAVAADNGLVFVTEDMC